jgi:hypothetical protein
LKDRRRGYWNCFLCETEYPNTLLYCQKCNIARKHSFTLEAKARKKEELHRQELITNIKSMYNLPNTNLRLEKMSIERLEVLHERIERYVNNG